MSKPISEYNREEIEQKIKDIKWALEKNVSSFEKYVLKDALAVWEKALLKLEGGER